MPYSTLADLFHELAELGDREALRYASGFRTWRWTYQEVASKVLSACGRLGELGLGPGDRLAIWSENRPEWILLFWASILRRIEIVPLDYRFSASLVERIFQDTNARLLVVGDSVDSTGVAGAPVIRIREFSACESSPPSGLPRLAPDDVVQIVYTSGTTGHPQGISHRHRNICANLEPFRREIQRYRRWARPFQPIRILNLLPLSHMFGQALALFIPPMLGGASVLCGGAGPRQILRLIRKERVSVLVVVPRMLANLTREVTREFGVDQPSELGRGWTGAGRRWWRYRKIHWDLGFKFWCVVVGGASLERESEVFWKRLGFLVVQGYGLTESSPVVAVNHPFRTRSGSVGKAIEGQNVRLAPDGEILVKGESVANRFAGSGPETPLLESDGWLHTGDVGEIDNEGWIYIRGRKKDIIVTSAGLNVYPRDVESVLMGIGGVRECVVVGAVRDGQEEVHAALILEPGAESPSEIIRRANIELEEHQRIRGWTVWPGADFPRTESTSKIRRREVARLIGDWREGRDSETPLGHLERIFEDIVGREVSTSLGGLRLAEDLGLTSLDRIELISRLEEHYGIALDDGQMAEMSTVSQLRQTLDEATRRRDPLPTVERADLRFPRWSRSTPVHLFRCGFQRCVMVPLFRHYVDLQVAGLDQLSRVRPPVIFAANHTSHLDTPALLCALPGRWRRCVAPAMLKDHFKPFFSPEGFSVRQRLLSSVQYFLACSLFNTFPLPHRMTGVRGALEYAGELSEAGWCLLVFPEGLRSPDGKLQVFKPGVGLLAANLKVAVVPVRIDGTFEMMSPQDRWPRRGAVSVRFGEPMSFQVGDAETITTRLESVIRNL